jgi:hypothetical protein
MSCIDGDSQRDVTWKNAISERLAALLQKQASNGRGNELRFCSLGDDPATICSRAHHMRKAAQVQDPCFDLRHCAGTRVAGRARSIPTFCPAHEDTRALAENPLNLQSRDRRELALDSTHCLLSKETKEL